MADTTSPIVWGYIIISKAKNRKQQKSSRLITSVISFAERWIILMQKLKTEMRNSNSTHIDSMDTMSMLNLINAEDFNSVRAVESALPQIAIAVDAITKILNGGGRLFYIGAGTSGRIAITDAAECPPTYGVPPGLVIGVIAGGKRCIVEPSEGAEDVYENGQKDLEAHNFNGKDAIVGISAAGGAAYIVGALEYANSLGAVTIGLSCNEGSKVLKITKIPILTDTGPEVITGSTRMKAGTAQKLVLNMLSTCAMIKTGKVYENYMINLKPSNIKLKRRMIGIVSDILQVDSNTAEDLLNKNEWNIRKAISGCKRQC